MATTAMSCATILNPMMDRGVDGDDGDDYVNDDNDLRAITPRFKVVTSDMRRDLPSGVCVLGSAYPVRVEGKGGGSVGGSSWVSLYHDASAAAIPWTNFTNASWVPGE